MGLFKSLFQSLDYTTIATQHDLAIAGGAFRRAKQGFILRTEADAIATLSLLGERYGSSVYHLEGFPLYGVKPASEECAKLAHTFLTACELYWLIIRWPLDPTIQTRIGVAPEAFVQHCWSCLPIATEALQGWDALNKKNALHAGSADPWFPAVEQLLGFASILTDGAFQPSSIDSIQRMLLSTLSAAHLTEAKRFFDDCMAHPESLGGGPPD